MNYVIWGRPCYCSVVQMRVPRHRQVLVPNSGLPGRSKQLEVPVPDLNNVGSLPSANDARQTPICFVGRGK